MVHQKFEEHDIIVFEKFNQLRDIAQFQGGQIVKREADKIDTDEVAKAVLYAEKKVSKANYGYGCWSPTLATSGSRNVIFWRKCLRTFKSG